MAAVEPLRDKKDVELMKTVLRNKNIRHYLLFIVGCNMGLRIGDILRLRVCDLVNEKGSLRKVVPVTEQKTGKLREIAINTAVQKAVKLFMDKCKPGYEDFLFTGRKHTGKAITSTQVYRILNDAATACKVEVRFGTHSLRKTFGYWVYKSSGNNIALVMDMLGHSSPAVTLRYVGITKEVRQQMYMSVEI